jgi:putative transcriptional regulator
MSRGALGFITALAAIAAVVATPGAWAQLPAIPMLLVAQPQVRDPLFRQSVVLVTRHGGSRPIGVILNHPQSPAASPGDAAKLPFVGGPVAPESVLYLFQAEGNVPANVLALGDNLYLGLGKEPLNDLEHRQPPASRLRVFQGLSTWSKGQLENEIARGDWLPLPFDAEVVFRTDAAALWRELSAKANGRAI